MSQPILTLCMIVRDSSRTLGACLGSIRPWVDEIIVVDTGSVDDTREIAKSFGAKVFEFHWIDDFSAARNESLRHACGNWLFWMDSDDTIDAGNGRRLRELAYGQHADNLLGYVVQVHCPAPRDASGNEMTVVDHVKLIRNHPEIRFEGRIHEQVLPWIRRLGGDIGWTDLFVVHSGSDQTPEGKARKIGRDLRILKLDAQERPDHPFVLFNLGMTYEDLGDYAAGEKWLRQCLAVSQPGESHLRKAYALLVSCLSHQQRHAEAHAVCRQGLELVPDDEELLFRRGILDYMARDLESAEAAYRAILTRDTARHFTSIDRGIVGYKTRHNLALVLEDRREDGRAEIQWRRACDESAGFRPAWLGLSQLLYRQNKHAALAVFLEEIAAHPAGGDYAEELATQLGVPFAGARDDRITDQTEGGDELTPRDADLPADEDGQWPTCHSRRIDSCGTEIVRLCVHPQMAIKNDVLPVAEICVACSLRHQPPPNEFRPMRKLAPRHSSGRCAHLGEEVGLRPCPDCSGTVRLKEFACRHPAHSVTTIGECQQCNDYQPAIQSSDEKSMPALPTSDA